MKSTLKLLFFLILMLLLAGCRSGDISITEVGPAGRQQYNNELTMLDGISSDTTNLLGNYLLLDMMHEQPEQFIPALERLLDGDRTQEVRIALAETSLILAEQYRHEPDKAVKYYLTALIHAQDYIAGVISDSANDLFDPDIQVAVRSYNMALTELFSYLKKRELHTASSFALTAAGGHSVNFTAPEFSLPVQQEHITDFLLCADFRTDNLTHNNRRFGIGVQLICELKKDAIPETVFAEEQVIPGTLAIKFTPDENSANRLNARLFYLDSRSSDRVKVQNTNLPLAQDFSTPLAYMIRKDPAINFLERAFLIDKSAGHEGLYHLEPHHDDRIPVVLVHGLMSDIRTWMQMLNTLLSDPVLRKHYRFMGFTYPSGSPIFFSGTMLRNALQAERLKLQRDGREMKNFDRMVIIGHSMGGLLSRMLISTSTEKDLEEFLGKKKFQKIWQKHSASLAKRAVFEPFPSVKRVIFIAVPHRGSSLADSVLGKAASALVRLPKNLLELNADIMALLLDKKEQHDTALFTGINNLSPRDNMLKYLNKIPMSPDVPVHSIIGNRHGGNIPGGSDGVVAYHSSHLNGVQSEKVVRSGHSVQQNPLAIQEIRRILRLHLQSFSDIKTELE
ncbi:MAG: alpha/beta hydrolase [Lentisphaeria bacterium]|nr:alpha/beta hydrolase [Lentisphaeria bacterium]